VGLPCPQHVAFRMWLLARERRYVRDRVRCRAGPLHMFRCCSTVYVCVWQEEGCRYRLVSTRTTHSANKSRREVVFAVGDLVLLNEKHFKESAGSNLAQADGSTKKLNALFRGPFSVTEAISDVVYRLELPQYMKSTSNAFHVSRLKPCILPPCFQKGQPYTGALSYNWMRRAMSTLRCLRSVDID
jgi:hypothetical protein